MFFDQYGCYVLRGSKKTKSGKVIKASDYNKRAFKIYIWFHKGKRPPKTA